MNCNEARLMTHAYMDGELDVLTTARIESHVQSCAVCNQRLGELTNLSRSIKNTAPYFKAPEGLRRRVQLQLREKETRAQILPLHDWRWARVAAAMVAAVVLSVSVTLHMNTPQTDEVIAHEVVSSHVRSLMAEHLTDVKSNDKHTVKPWFTGRLDFSPPVQDLASKGFMLVGGRLEFLENRQAAALVYQYRKHVINLFIWPTAREQGTNVEAHPWQGYQAYEWTLGGLQFWAVSDLNDSELIEFVRLQQGVPTTVRVE